MEYHHSTGIVVGKEESKLPQKLRLDMLEPESINLMKTSKFMSDTVMGAIGEIIAWQYLAKKLYNNPRTVAAVQQR